MNLHTDQLIRLDQNFNNFPQTAGYDFFCKYAWNIHLGRINMVLYNKSHENIKIISVALDLFSTGWEINKTFPNH